MLSDSGVEIYDEVFRCNELYRIGIIRTWDQFLSVQEMWDALVERHGDHEPFLCHDWFRIWLKHFQGSSELFVAVVLRGETPVLIAPLLKKVEKYKKVAKVRKIEFIGNHHSPIKCFIFGEKEASERVESLRCLFKLIMTYFRNWDILELDSIPEELEVVPITEQSLKANRASYMHLFCFNDWLLENNHLSGEEYLNNRSKNLKKELKRRMKRLQELGEVNFIVGDCEDEFETYFESYREVRVKSWKHSESDVGFLHEFRKWAMMKGWLKFTFLTVNGLPISTHIRLVAHNTAYLMESVYDKSFKEYSPTTLLRSLLMPYIIDNEKVRKIDTIRGDESYKIEWTPTKRQRIGVSVFNYSIKGQFIRLLITVVVPILKRIKKLTRSDIISQQSTESP
ncbi:MAG TPA: GNAT family N-acetyltransferase [Alphaproteobacteria bacterium]|nr:GNAT family N-acetyltransferase [Alphaproteobacteria bacterium]